MSDSKIDLLIAALGYEDRCIHASRILEATPKSSLAIKFTKRQVHSFARNEKWFVDNGFTIIDYARGAIADALHKHLEQTSAERPTTVVVDISSMSRPMIGEIVHSLSIASKVRNPIRVKFVYCPAEYSPAPDTLGPIRHSGPVSAAYAGWFNDLSKPLVAIFGLGYEPDYAFGTMELLEPAQTFAFAPTGEDSQYDKSVLIANHQLLLSTVDQKPTWYRVDQPNQMFVVLENLVYGLTQHHRTVLIPFGPKVFSLMCFLVAAKYLPSISVWRVSGEQGGPAIERRPNGKIVEAEFDFRRGVPSIIMDHE